MRFNWLWLIIFFVDNKALEGRTDAEKITFIAKLAKDIKKKVTPDDDSVFQARRIMDEADEGAVALCDVGFGNIIANKLEFITKEAVSKRIEDLEKKEKELLVIREQQKKDKEDYEALLKKMETLRDRNTKLMEKFCNANSDDADDIENEMEKNDKELEKTRQEIQEATATRKRKRKNQKQNASSTDSSAKRQRRASPRNKKATKKPQKSQNKDK